MKHVANSDHSKNYLVVPRINCEQWEYLPVCFTDKISAGNYWHIAPQSDLFQFAILNSSMHMAWIRHVSGHLNRSKRLERVPAIKHFPWPITHTQAQITSIKEKAAAILAIRGLYPAMSLKDLYTPITMPVTLKNAHKDLDKAVDAAYGRKDFASDDSRIEFLLHLQRQLSSLLIHIEDDSAAFLDPIHYHADAFDIAGFSNTPFNANTNNSVA